MNIGFAFTWQFNPNVGGTERVTDLLAKELKNRGHTIYYLYTVRRPSDCNFESPAKKSLFLPEIDFKTGKLTEVYHSFIRENNIEVVINQGGVMGTCKNFAIVPDSCKNVTVIHFDPKYGLDSLLMEQLQLRNKNISEKFKRIYRLLVFPYRYFKLKGYLNSLYKYWGNHSNRVVLLSDLFRNSFYDVCPSFPSEKLHAISNPTSFESSYNCVKKKMIIWVGRMDFRQKRPDLMVKVWKEVHQDLPDWELIMLGDGNALSSVKQLAEGLPRISFPGFCNPMPYFQMAEICCTSSSSEGWGMVLCEAMSQGAVPIGFDSYESIREMIETDEQLVTPYDIKEYAAKLINLANSSELRELLRRNGYETVKRFSISHIADKWEELLTNL